MSHDYNAHTTEAPTDYRGRTQTFYHPNAKGTGSAMRLEPRINRDDEDRYNCFFVEMAAQKAAGSSSGGTAYAAFDWDNKITVKLGFSDICELLLVLEGQTQKVGGNRNGLYHATHQGNTLISFSYDTQRATYYLSLSRKRHTDAQAQRIGMALSAAEAIGLRCLLQTGLFFVTFPSALRARRPAAKLTSNHAENQCAA